MAQHFESVEEYIASFPADVQEALQEIRRCCHAAVPGSGEMISYGIPTITLGGKYVVYFAGWAHHISVYPVPDGDESLSTELAPYRETGHRILIESLERRGNVAEALRAYERLRVLLRDELGIAPGPEVQAVHARLIA